LYEPGQIFERTSIKAPGNRARPENRPITPGFRRGLHPATLVRLAEPRDNYGVLAVCWLRHRATHIEHAAGGKESLIHLPMQA
jgi:hypothetical protein